MMKAISIAVVLGGLGAAAGTARAGHKREADALFKRAKQLLAEKKYAAACAKFEESYQLDPGIGGELNIGRCYEEWGKLGHAYRAYAEAERQATAAKDRREPEIHKLVAGFEPSVPRLVIHVPPAADARGLEVTIDGEPVAAGDLGRPQLVDPGPKRITYTIGGVARSKTVAVERGGTSEITLELPAASRAEPAAPVAPVHPPVAEAPPAPRAPGEPERPGRERRWIGIGLGAAGLVTVGVASYLALSARSRYKDALAADCMNAKDLCDPQGLTATHDARSRANIATVVGAVGLAAVAGGVVLYLLAPHAASSEHAYYVVPTSNGLAVGGRL